MPDPSLTIQVLAYFDSHSQEDLDAWLGISGQLDVIHLKACELAPTFDSGLTQEILDFTGKPGQLRSKRGRALLRQGTLTTQADTHPPPQGSA